MVRTVRVLGMVESDGFEGGGRFRVPIRGGGGTRSEEGFPLVLLYF